MKLKILISLLLLFSVNLFASIPDPPGESLKDLSLIREQVSITFHSQVGVSELTGRNDGVMVETYLASADLRRGDPWCAAFVNWCFEKNGVAGPDRLAGYSPSWFPKDRHSNDPPLRADVFGIYYASKGRIAHVGFIDRWCNSYALTVEGNSNDSGSRDGTAVVKKRRLTRQLYATSNWIGYRYLKRAG